ncbi:DNA cytosine methyltransferase [Kitasatospora sp. NPDC059795]|uniref:DNA cytosine methyltransferase n=1 Tax=Kitasatospora sp. NPDC059795 TaxID=3346949 RepID=UPI0036466B9D
MLTVTDFFCGAGGSSQGMHNVPGLSVATAANHWDLAVRSHQANFPDTRHDCADISQIDFRRYPRTDLLWASPECTNHSVAKGVRRTGDRQPDLFGEVLPDEAAVRSRATMWDVPRYLEAMTLRGRPVLGGVVENVVDARTWVMFDAWCAALRALGYDLRIVYLNSMHARPRFGTPLAPQSRDRMYVLYWRKGNRAPDVEKWTRPDATCPEHGRIRAVQSWKNPDKVWGRYRAQYAYRCPVPGCWTVVEPFALPAAAAIDWTQPGQRIGDRPKPLAPKTLARITAGLKKYAAAEGVPPFLVPLRSGRNRSLLADRDPLATVVADGGNHGLTTAPPLLVPVEGREGKAAQSAADPMRTMTTRNETAVAWFEPFLAELRGGGSDHRPASQPLATICASGNHHGLVAPPLLVPAGGTWNDEARPVDEPFRARTTRETEALLVPYYGNGTATPVERPAPTVTSVDRHALVTAEPAVEECLFRMLSPAEIGAAMAFGRDYTVLGNKREQVRQYGNAVTPPAAEVLMSALVEAITGEDLETTR